MKVFFKTVGCRVNQIETQSLAEKFLKIGYHPVPVPEEADLIVVNSCSVTEYADRDTLNFIKKAAAANPSARLVVTGCMATLSPEKITALAPAAAIFPNSEKELIPRSVSGAAEPPDFFTVKGFTGRTRAFVKIQEGCDLHCAYCLVPAARNTLSSKPLKSVLSEIKALISGGFKEIVLCGTRLGIYECSDTGKDLSGLMADIFGLDGEFRIRFSSLEPPEVSEELAAVLKNGGDKFCDYFHLPVQSGSAAVLKAMGRPYTPEGYVHKLDILRKAFVNPGIFADIIAGYPAETDEQFEESLKFTEKCGLAGLHVFRFSPRKGTRAALLKPHPAKIVSQRAARLRELDARLRAAYAASMLGRNLNVLILKNKNGFTSALASNFVTVTIKGRHPVGALVSAKIAGAAGGVCFNYPPG